MKKYRSIFILLTALVCAGCFVLLNFPEAEGLLLTIRESLDLLLKWCRIYRTSVFELRYQMIAKTVKRK